jgi:hypothetical protein
MKPLFRGLDVIEKRRSPRKAILSNCMVKRIFLKEPLFSTKVINYSVNGLMLESDVKFLPGDAITIHFSHEIQKETSFFSEICLGLVRWCVQQDGDYGGIYGVGVELAMQ